MLESPPPPTGPDKLRTLIVDDEAPARERLRRMLEEFDDVAVDESESEYKVRIRFPLVAGPAGGTRESW